MRLVPCPHCDHHTWSNERACPHCGGTLEPSRGRLHSTAAAVLLGLAACTSTERPPAKDGDDKAATPKKEDPPVPIAEPEYGVPEVPVDDIPEAPAYGAPPTEDPAQDVPDAPAYGDPVTDLDEPPEPVAEPEYGVPISETPK